MKFNFKKALISFIFSMPIIAHAQITIENNTDQFITATVASSPCSAEAGDRGIVKPHNSLKIPLTIIATYCGFSDCTAHIFIDKNCQKSKEVATAIVNSINGIASINNENTRNYEMTSSAYNFTIKQINLNQLKNWFNNLFS